LRARYRAFHRYLPELFLWHVFNSLAKAILELENVHDAEQPLGKYVVHADIKLANIFLGYEELHGPPERTGGLQSGKYPTVKLGDFGCANLARDNDRANSNRMTGFGTPGCYPPEQRIDPYYDNGAWAYGHDFVPPVNVGNPTMSAQANV